MLDTRYLYSDADYQRAFLVLCFLAHGYIWGKAEVVTEVLPAAIAKPWVAIADHLGLCPVVCHAAVVLYNWKLLATDNVDLSNMSTMLNFTGTGDESWFYLVTTAIEAKGAPAIQLIIDALEAVNDRDDQRLLVTLRNLNTVIQDITNVIVRMYEKCDPYIFYWKVRPYLAGWQNMAEVGLPKGIIYEGVDEPDQDGEPVYRTYAGGSAAQSALIHALDIALGIEHLPTGEKRSKSGEITSAKSISKQNFYNSGDSNSEITENVLHADAASRNNDARLKRNNFIDTMRKYMPGPHRQFLLDLTKVSSIRPYVLSVGAHTPALLDVYNDCLASLRRFRDKHIQMVTLYIVLQAKKPPPSLSNAGLSLPNEGPSSPQSNARKMSVDNSSIPAAFASIMEQRERKGETMPRAVGEKTRSPAESSSDEAPALSLPPPIGDGAQINYPQRVIGLVPSTGLAKALQDGEDVVRGTGGTDLIPFLKQARDEVTRTKMSADEVATSQLEYGESWCNGA